jgi:hypothetical protein
MRCLPSTCLTPATDFLLTQPDRHATGFGAVCTALPINSISKRSVLFMRNDTVGRSKPAAPHCSSCAQAMRLARKTQRFNDLPELYIFECRTCQMSLTEEGTPSRNAETEVGSWYLDEFGNPTREIKESD